MAKEADPEEIHLEIVDGNDNEAIISDSNNSQNLIADENQNMSRPYRTDERGRSRSPSKGKKRSHLQSGRYSTRKTRRSSRVSRGGGDGFTCTKTRLKFFIFGILIGLIILLVIFIPLYLSMHKILEDDAEQMLNDLTTTAGATTVPPTPGKCVSLPA